MRIVRHEDGPLKLQDSIMALYAIGPRELQDSIITWYAIGPLELHDIISFVCDRLLNSKA